MNFFYSKFYFCDSKILVCTLLLTFNGHAQNCTFKETYPENNSDSLERWLILNPKICENRLKNLIKIERRFLWELNVNRFKYQDEIEKTAKKLNNLSGIAYFKFHKAIFLNEESKNNRSLKLLGEALKIVEGLNDTSGQINVLGYMGLMYLNHGTPENNNLAKYYIFKAKNLISQSNDPHAKMQFSLIYLTYEVSLLKSSNAVKLPDISQILKLYNNNPKLEYTYLWVKSIESDFNYRTKNYDKSILIYKELLKKVKPNDFHLLSRINSNLAKNYLALTQYENALINIHLALSFLNKTHKIAYSEQTTETTNALKIAILNTYRSIVTKLNNSKTSAALADSIIYYQKLELENKNSILNKIQSRYNFEWSETELKELVTEKNISELRQNNLRSKLEIEQHKFKTLLFKNELELSKEKIKQIQHNSEKQIAFAKSKIIQNKNERLYIYILTISILLLLVIILLLISRTYYRKEKKITMFRDEFYTILTHDLRTSINSLTGMGSVLSHLIRHKNIEEMGVVANQIDYLGYNTSLLLDNMLDWGTSSSYGVNTSPKSIDMCLFINELVGRYLAALKTKNIEIIVNAPPNLVMITSPKCVDVIIRNLIANAMCHTPSGGRININVREIQDSHQIFIEVNDSGSGIVTKKLEFIKEVFAGKIKPEVGDSGIGLGILLISHFAKKNKINLNVTSEVGIGSCFTLIFDTNGQIHQPLVELK